MNRANGRLASLTFVLLASPGAAHALPRFAARTGADCQLCHVNPSGGGVRSRYGSHVFQQLSLPLELGSVPTEDEGAADWTFSGQVNEWLTLGGDLRAAYLFTAPERSPIAGEEPQHTSTFFLMQADLYAAARFGPHLSLVFDLGAYSGFEAWVLISAASGPSDFDLQVKIGRFMPNFGIREVNHDLYTRAGVGLGASSRDTGVELTGVAGPFSLSLSILNGTFDDLAFDTHGGDHRSFEKALTGRLWARFGPDWLHLQLGGSINYSDNADAANPLFSARIDPAVAAAGVDELRAGGFAMIGLGRFTYLTDLVVVRDRFVSGSPQRLTGYASYQELGAVIFQGLELMATLEFQDSDVSVAEDAVLRVGGAVEVFPFAFLDVRAMIRHAFGGALSAGDVTDVLFFAHAAF
ncbi:MAG: hypothetical protein IT384_06810 [Deltaproteobacteria bacterium]|nr:hypothetical protein [Deltaproteobacteria bacterium]